MRIPPRDAAGFFAAEPTLLPIYEALAHAVSTRWPEISVRVQKSQISFDSRRPFCAAWRPSTHGMKRRFPHCLGLSLYLPAPLEHPRILRKTEPYPGRWTHHMILSDPAEVNEELLTWLEQARSWRDSV